MSEDRFEGLTDQSKDQDTQTNEVEKETKKESGDKGKERTQKTIYAYPETFQKLEDTIPRIDLKLREEDIRDVEKTEIYDAALQVAVENPDKIIQKIKQNKNKK